VLNNPHTIVNSQHTVSLSFFHYIKVILELFPDTSPLKPIFCISVLLHQESSLIIVMLAPYLQTIRELHVISLYLPIQS